MLRMNTPSDEDIRDLLIQNATSGPAFADFLIDFDKKGFLGSRLPEFKRTQFQPHDKKHHPEAKGTVWGHIIAAIRASNSNEPLNLLCTAWHDCGKGRPLAADTGAFTYADHHLVGVPVFFRANRRLKFDADYVSAITHVIEHHHQARYLIDRSCPRAQVIRLRGDPRWDILRETMTADLSCRLHLWNPEQWLATMAWAERVYEEWLASIADHN